MFSVFLRRDLNNKQDPNNSRNANNGINTKIKWSPAATSRDHHDRMDAKNSGNTSGRIFKEILCN